MNKFLKILAVVILFIGPANAEWTYVTKLSDNSSKIYIDLDTFKKNGNQVFIWKLSDLTVPHKGTKSSAMYEQMDCSTKSATTLQYVFYDGQMGTGKPESFKRDNQKWRTYPPGSYMYSLIKVLCGD